MTQVVSDLASRGGVRALVHCLEVCSEDLGIVTHCCLALRDACRADGEAKHVVRECGGVDAVVAVLRGSCINSSTDMDSSDGGRTPPLASGRSFRESRHKQQQARVCEAAAGVLWELSIGNRKYFVRSQLVSTSCAFKLCALLVLFLSVIETSAYVAHHS